MKTYDTRNKVTLKMFDEREKDMKHSVCMTFKPPMQLLFSSPVKFRASGATLKEHYLDFCPFVKCFAKEKSRFSCYTCNYSKTDLNCWSIHCQILSTSKGIKGIPGRHFEEWIKYQTSSLSSLSSSFYSSPFSFLLSSCAGVGVTGENHPRVASEQRGWRHVSMSLPFHTSTPPLQTARR